MAESSPIATSSARPPLQRQDTPEATLLLPSKGCKRTKTVAVLGAAYGGTRAANILAQGLPEGWRVVIVDRNSHMNHLYVLPRYGVVPGHEHKAFIPLRNIFYNNSPTPAPESHPHRIVHAQVTKLTPHSVELSHPLNGVTELPIDVDGVPVADSNAPDGHHVLRFDYAVYALGSRLPAPIDIWDASQNIPPSKSPEDATSTPNAQRQTFKKQGTKEEAVEWLKRCQERVAGARSVLIVGGGALGIQFASDIAEHYPGKRVTLLHSRHQLLPKFDPALGSEVLSTLTALDVNVLLGERLDLSTVKTARPAKGGHEERVVRTLSGREIRAELVLLCTGQTPNTGLIKELLPDAIVPSGPDYGLVRVSRSMQVGVPATSSSVPSTPAAAVVPPADALDASAVTSSLSSSSLAQADSVFASADCSEAVDSLAPGAPDYSEHTGGRPRLHIPYPHLFCVGDSADAFGAIKAGHTAYWQAEVAARNILRMVRAEVLRERIEGLRRAGASGEGQDCLIEELEAECKREEVLEKYAPGPPAIKVSLGLDKSAYQVNGEVGTKSDCSEDLDVKLMWAFCGITDVDEAGMYA